MKTPSWKLNQPDDENKYQDKYTGRMLKMLHSIPEADIYECNPEYIEMLNDFINGELNEDNLSEELYAECIITVDAINEDRVTWSEEDAALFTCFDAVYPGIIPPEVV